MNICHTTVRHIYLKMAKMVNFMVPIFDHSGKNGNDDNDNNKVLLKQIHALHLHYEGRAESWSRNTLVCKVYPSIHYLALDKQKSAAPCFRMWALFTLVSTEWEHSDGW